jgi:hypothetical protein
MIEYLKCRDYPCADTYDDDDDSYDHVRMIVQTYDQLCKQADLRLDETCVLFTIDLSVLSDLCEIADIWDIHLLVTLAK